MLLCVNFNRAVCATTTMALYNSSCFFLRACKLTHTHKALSAYFEFSSAQRHTPLQTRQANSQTHTHINMHVCVCAFSQQQTLMSWLQRWHQLALIYVRLHTYIQTNESLLRASHFAPPCQYYTEKQMMQAIALRACVCVCVSHSN